MKKLIATLVAALPLIGMAQSNPFTIRGKIGTLNAPAKIYLDYTDDGKSMSDSAMLINGEFTLSGKIGSPSFTRIILDYDGKGKDYSSYMGDVRLFYMGAEKVQITAKDSLKHAAIQGSAVNDEYNAYLKKIGGPFQDIVNAANAAFRAIPEAQSSDTSVTNAIDRKFRLKIKERENQQLKFAKENPSSFFSVVALSEAAGTTMDVPTIEPLFMALNSKVKGTDAGIEFGKRITAAKATLNGKPAPMFTQNDVNDKPVSLSDFKGKYVLIDFWASWCGPCRAENPNLKAAYNQYKDKNFRVLGVSLDQPGKKDAWLAAIEKDGLTWTNVSDLKYWNNEVAKLYGVRAVPQNYLVDPNGIIIAQNLRGEALFEKLQSLLGK